MNRNEIAAFASSIARLRGPARRNGSLAILVSLAAAVTGCERATGPNDAPLEVSALNTMAIRTTGAAGFELLVDPEASFGYLLDGTDGDHVHIGHTEWAGDVNLSLSLPGTPGTGRVTLGAPDPFEVHSRNSPPGRIPFLTLITGTTAADGSGESGTYQNLAGGTVEIEYLALPERGSMTPGEIRGRVSTRAAGNRVILGAGGAVISASPDTIHVEVAFWVELEAMPYGTGVGEFAGGTVGSIEVPDILGFVTDYGDLSILHLRAETRSSGQANVTLAATTDLFGPGIVSLDARDPLDPNGRGISGVLHGPIGWLNLEPVAGTLEIETWTPATATHFGEASGTLTVTFESGAPGDGATTGTVSFRVPVRR